MDLLNHLFFGIGMAFIAVTLPGMVNMTAVSTSINYGLSSGIKFSIGASAAMLFQAFIAVAFAGYLSKHPEVFLFLKRAAVIIFLILSVVFLRQALRSRVAEASSKKGHPMFLGLLIAGMNALTIPFFFTISTFLEAKDYIRLTSPYRWVFLAGAFFGAQLLLAVYAYFARFIANRAGHLARNFNFFLSGFFLILAFIQLVDLYYD